jgi:hypothetical protein
MLSVYDTVFQWARRQRTSFAELRFASSERSSAEPEDSGLIYRLKHWPELPSRIRTADVLRALSVMSNRPINRNWILTHSKLRAQDVDSLLARLVAQGAVEVIDGSRFPADRAVGH